MDFSVKAGALGNPDTGCVVVGIYEKRVLTRAAAALDEQGGGAISHVLKSGDHKGKPGETLLLHALPGIAAERVLLVGCGKEAEEIGTADYRKALTGACNALKGTGAKSAVFALTDLAVTGRDSALKVRDAALALGNALYLYEETKSEKSAQEDRPPLKKVAYVLDEEEVASGKRGLAEARALLAGLELTKRLANLPGNICTPSYLADQAKKLGHAHDTLDVTIVEEKEMEKLGMGALLSVAKGSRQPPRLIVVEYRGGKKKQKPVVLVGKGLTFDAGGISLKPAAAMDEMKYDMSGGAAVLGVMKALAELKLPINVTGVVPASENLPDGAANKPGDVVTSMSGQTIEILNTDAEGRLILCDALTYSRRFEPEVVVDIATLTGACVVALGKPASGLLGNDQTLVNALLSAGERSGDRAWQLPLWEEYQDQLKSPFADMANVGGREGGTITAACFLSRYTKDLKWAHLDIAATAWDSGANKGATGRPLPLLMQYLIDRAGERG